MKIKKKKKIRKNILIIFILAIAIIGSSCYYIFFRKEKINIKQEENKILENYSNEAQQTIKENHLDDKIENYNKTIEAFAKNSLFNEKYLEEYAKITFRETANFVEDTTKLLEKNYNADEINQIYEYLSTKNIQKLLQKDYTDLKDFYKIANLDVNQIANYKNYQKAKNISLEDAVTQVNLHLNEEFYQNVVTVANPDDITVLVNKFHALPADYVPKDLVNVGNYSLQMRQEASQNLEKLIAAALTENIVLIPYSTYRSYDYQKKLYESYLKVDPVSVVDTYSARPGHSEHQTGLACDIRSQSLNDRLTDNDYEWMLNNSYLYGFIVRYPKNGSTITGYMEEPWHIRYIGLEHAKKVHDLKITYDEYYDLYIEKY